MATAEFSKFAGIMSAALEQHRLLGFEIAQLYTQCTAQTFLLYKDMIRRMRKATASAAAKSLQSCPTLCDPIDSSPPGSPVPGILQARTLEWVGISFSNT